MLHHSLARRPRPFQESATWSASFAAECLLAISFAGPWSARAFFAWRPLHSFKAGRVSSRWLFFWPHVLRRLLVHGVQLDAASTSSWLMLFHASATAFGASGHASDAFCALAKASLKSCGACSSLASSHF